MNYADIVDALTSLSLATPREICDFTSLKRITYYYQEKTPTECILHKRKIPFYVCDEHFAKKRYCLSYKGDNAHPLPAVHSWGFTQDRILKHAKTALKGDTILSLEEHNVVFCPDVARSVVFCIKNKRRLDGVVDFRRRKSSKIRFPTLVFKTWNRDRMSEWLRACHLFSNSDDDVKTLSIGGTDI